MDHESVRRDVIAVQLIYHYLRFIPEVDWHLMTMHQQVQSWLHHARGESSKRGPVEPLAGRLADLRTECERDWQRLHRLQQALDPLGGYRDTCLEPELEPRWRLRLWEMMVETGWTSQAAVIEAMETLHRHVIDAREAFETARGNSPVAIALQGDMIEYARLQYDSIGERAELAIRGDAVTYGSDSSSADRLDEERIRLDARVNYAGVSLDSPSIAACRARAVEAIARLGQELTARDDLLAGMASGRIRFFPNASLSRNQPAPPEVAPGLDSDPGRRKPSPERA